MKKYIALTVCLVIGLSYWAWHHAHKKPPEVKTVVASLGSITTTATAIGNIIPKQTIIVKSQVSGTADTVYADVGDYVKTGAPLVKVKPNPVPSELAQKIGVVAEDKAALNGAQLSLKNFNYLYKNKIILDNNAKLLQAQQGYDSALARYTADKQSLNLYQHGKAKIGGKLVQNMVTSPTTGFILQRNINPGDTINSVSDMQAATALFAIANMKELIFEGTVDERDADKLHIGMPAAVTIGALPNQKINGKIISVSLQSDARNSADIPAISLGSSSNSSSNQSPFNVGFQVKVGDMKIPTNLKLRSGFSATANMVIAEKKGVLVISQNLIVFKDNKIYVSVENPTTHKATLTAVTLGLTDGNQVEITSGIKPGALLKEPETKG